MPLTIFSFMSSVIWVSLFAIIIRFSVKKMFLLRNISIYPLIFFSLMSFIRLFLPLELPYTQIIRSKHFLPALQHILYDPLIFHDHNYININLNNIFILIWVIGILFRFYKEIPEYRLLHFILFCFPESNDKRIKDIFTKVQNNSLTNKKVRIIVHSYINTPAIICFLTPIIILPNIEFTDNELFGILTHEWMHYCKGHTIIKLVGELIAIVFWWNPFLKLLNSDIVNILEMHSDQNVSKILNKQDLYSYLNAIIKVINNKNISINLPTISCCLVENMNSLHLEQRFLMLLEGNYSKNKASRIFIPFILIFLFLSYTFVFQPYASPPKYEYGTMTEVCNDDYLVETGSGYNLYNSQGKFKATIIFIDDSLDDLTIRKDNQP